MSREPVADATRLFSIAAGSPVRGSRQSNPVAVWAGGGAFQARAQSVRPAGVSGSLDSRFRGNDGAGHEPDTIRPQPLVAAISR